MAFPHCGDQAMAGSGAAAGRRRVELLRAIRAASAGADRAAKRLLGGQIQWPTYVCERAVPSLQRYLQRGERAARRPAQPLRMSGQTCDLSRTDSQRSRPMLWSAWEVLRLWRPRLCRSSHARIIKLSIPTIGAPVV